MMPCSRRMKSCYAGCLHRRWVEDYLAAREAQMDRAEAWSNGYPTELAEFYRTQEKRITLKDWMIHSQRHDRV